MTVRLLGLASIGATALWLSGAAYESGQHADEQLGSGKGSSTLKRTQCCRLPSSHGLDETGRRVTQAPVAEEEVKAGRPRPAFHLEWTVLSFLLVNHGRQPYHKFVDPWAGGGTARRGPHGKPLLTHPRSFFTRGACNRPATWVDCAGRPQQPRCREEEVVSHVIL
jgi:hypothetical protein